MDDSRISELTEDEIALVVGGSYRVRGSSGGFDDQGSGIDPNG